MKIKTNKRTRVYITGQRKGYLNNLVVYNKLPKLLKNIPDNKLTVCIVDMAFRWKEFARFTKLTGLSDGNFIHTTTEYAIWYWLEILRPKIKRECHTNSGHAEWDEIRRFRDFAIESCDKAIFFYHPPDKETKRQIKLAKKFGLDIRVVKY